MDSPGHLHGHLEATPSREVVYCHACSNEWYRVDHGLVCPGCTSEATEIISSDSDPRDFNDGSASTSPEPHDPFHFHNEHDHDHDHDHDHGPDGHDHSHDSDPDEADIEEHMIPPGFHYRRSVLERPGLPHHDPDVDPVFERFFGLIHDLAPPPRRTGGSGMFQQRGGEESRFGGPHIHRATFTNGSGSASVTIFSGPSSGFFSSGSPNYDHHGDPFQAFFNNVLRDEAPPGGGREAGGGTSPGFARGLQEILNLFNPAHAISGDAVYSQEALDQIITNLMEAHPQSNAAPPASTEALANLNRRPVDASMLDGESKTECTICIDDMKVGDLAAFLPCKHWFHEACVVLWLKEHNTCPVCRASIEKGGEGNSGANANANASGPSGSGSSQSDDQSGSGLDRSGPLPIPGARPSQLSRPPSQSQSRLNEAMRSISSRQQERQQQQERERERYRVWGVSSPTERQRDERERERSRLWGARSSSGYDTSRMQRRSSRNSLSPTSPRMTLADYRERQRQESPPQSSRRDGDNAETSRQTATSGALNWLRDRFTGGGSRDDSNRDDR